MLVIAHAVHSVLGLLQLAPIVVALAFAVWKTRAERRRRRSNGPVAGTS